MNGPGSSARGRQRVVWAVAAAIALLGAGLRFAWAGEFDWDSDTALHYLRAAELARGERLDLLVGFRTHAGGARLPPLFHYVLALPAGLGAGPLPVVGWVAAIDLCTVLLLVGPGRRVWGTRVALLAGLSYAVLADAVLRARALRNETLLGPLLLLVLILCARARRRPHSGAAGLGLATVVTMPQLHLSALFALPALLPSLAPHLYRAGLTRALPGVFLAVLVSAPFFVHETRSGLHETRAILHGAGGADQPGEPGETVHARGAQRLLRGSLSLARELSTADAEEVLGPSLSRVASADRPLWLRPAVAVAKWVLPGLALLGLGLGLLGSLGPALRQVALVAGGTLVSYVVVGVRALEPYVVLIVPLTCLLAAGALVSAWRALPRLTPALGRGRPALIALVALGLAGQAALAASGVRAIAAHGGARDRLARLTYGSTRAAADWILAHDYALARFPAWQHCLMLDVAWRALPPERQVEFQPRAQVLPYWDLPYLVPVPRGSVRVVSLEELELGAPTPAGALARFGPLIVREERGQ